MNVLLTVPWDNLGGVCNVVNEVALRLRRRGHGVWLLLPGEGNEPTETTSRMGLPAFRLNLRPPHVEEAPVKSRLAFRAHLTRTRQALRGLMGDLGIDVVNIHFPHDSSI